MIGHFLLGWRPAGRRGQPAGGCQQNELGRVRFSGRSRGPMSLVLPDVPAVLVPVAPGPPGGPGFRRAAAGRRRGDLHLVLIARR